MKQDLFARMSLPYYLYSPAYANQTDEARILHHLCHALNLSGQEAYVTEPGDGALYTPRLTQDRIEAHLQAGRTPIVIYPGSEAGNPLGADQVVRYLLAPQDQRTAGAGETLVAWRAGLAAASVPVLTTPLADDAAGRDAFERELRDFIDATQRQFSAAPATTAAPAASPAAVPVSAAPAASTASAASAAPPVSAVPASRPARAQIMPGRLARPLARLHAASATPEQAVPIVSASTPSPAQDAPVAAATPPDAGHAAPQRKKRIVVFSVESTWSPCPQIRLIRPFAHLQGQWELIWGIRDGKLQGDYLNDADLIALHRFTPGLMPIDTLKVIFASKVPIVYESDDLLNDIPHDHPEAQQGASWKEGIEYAVRHAKAVVVSTPYLAQRYLPLNPAVHVLPNYIDFDLFYRPVPHSTAPDGKINIGVLGSSIQPSNFALIDDALRAMVERYGARLHIDFVGWECPAGWVGHPLTTFHSFVHQYVDYAAQLLQWNWDIALIPLASDDYNQCKSYIKWLDYSAAGIASIFSDVSVYNEVVTHGETGLLMPNSVQAWTDALSMLIDSPEQRHALARAAQQEVKTDFDLARQVTLYDRTYAALL